MVAKTVTTTLGLSFVVVLLFFGCASKLTTSHQASSNEKTPEGMVYLPGGTFAMGSNLGKTNETPLHKIEIEPFYIDIHEVTVKQYRTFLTETGYQQPAYWQPEFDRPDDPVVGITWYDALAYAIWADKRLPTEAEWEYAARGGSVGTIYPWGNEPNRKKANYSSSGISPVERFTPNGYGIHDMIGNVWEWCADWYSASFYQSSPKSNPEGPVMGTHKVLRGGTWYSNEEQIRITNRYFALPDIKSFHIGFRCAQSAH
jgi:iron(II)-dependent oxidoreductase